MKDGQPDSWGREYAVTIGNLSKEEKLAFKDAGLLDRVKDKLDDLGDQITFRLDEFKRDGTPNDPIVITDAATGKEWDWKVNGLIGNGSKGIIKFNVWRGGAGKPRIYPVALLVTEHVEYEQPEDQNEYEDPNDWSEYLKPAAAKTAKKSKPVTAADDLDDEIPY